MRATPEQLLLLSLQITAYAGLLSLFIWGSWYHWGLALAAYFVMGCLGVTVTYHRLLAHRSWNPPGWFRIVGSLAGTVSLIGSGIAWTALHRQHHRFTDRQGDPHSPRDGFLLSQFGGIFEPVNIKYVPDLLRDPLQVRLHRYYFHINISVLILLMLIDPLLCAAVYLAPAALVHLIGGAVNSFNHSDLGYRNYDTKDNSRNIPVLGYLMWGEGWHNNHHGDPSDPQFGRKHGEFDPGGWIIKRLNTL